MNLPAELIRIIGDKNKAFDVFCFLRDNFEPLRPRDNSYDKKMFEQIAKTLEQLNKLIDHLLDANPSGSYATLIYNVMSLDEEYFAALWDSRLRELRDTLDEYK